MGTLFDVNCTRCSRLSGYLRELKQSKPDYYCAPVPSFGVVHSPLIIVGLAPGKHGANRTGRPFTGDYAGEVLYRVLHRYGFATKAVGVSRDDGLKLKDCRITNAVKCLPPGNRPNTDEIRRCNGFLQAELERLPSAAVVLALGRIAHNAVLQALGLVYSAHPFGHNVLHRLDDGLRLLSSYHCSRYNINTGRLTEAQFEKVVGRARRLLKNRK